MPTVYQALTYAEPTTTTDSAPLTDLRATRVYYTLPGGSATLGATTDASTPTGGGTRTTTVAVVLANTTPATVAFVVRAVNPDHAGVLRESADSAVRYVFLSPMADPTPRPRTRVEVVRGKR